MTDIRGHQRSISGISCHNFFNDPIVVEGIDRVHADRGLKRSIIQSRDFTFKEKWSILLPSPKICGCTGLM